MSRPLFGVLLGALPLALLLTSCQTTPATAPAALSSGIDMKNMDLSVRPQDDFYRYTSGSWLKATSIPADKSAWGSFTELRDNADANLRTLVDGIVALPGKVVGSEEQKISDLYLSFMDQAGREARGIRPLKADFERIDALRNKAELPAVFAALTQMRVTTPLGIGVAQDAKDATRYAVYIRQSGLGLPDRDYYLNDKDAKLQEARAKYEALVARMLGLAGDPDGAAHARGIVALETELAKLHWTRVDNRNPVKTYNKVSQAQLAEMVPGFDWQAEWRALGIEGAGEAVIVAQPSFLTGFAQVLEATPLDTWKAYLKWHVIGYYAPFLSKTFADDAFAFYSTTLRGVPVQEPAWQRGIRVVEGSLGEALGKRYVARYFPPEYKQRMERLVGHLIAAFGDSIDDLDWMSPATKQQARAKLATINPKIGYPNKWRDYSAISIAKDDLIGNLKRVSLAESQRTIARLGKPVDREEWGMTPQTVNAYYNPRMNEIVFPAAILQPPFFNAAADDAVNYGGIVAVIGHEIGHAFDDQGSQSDEIGNLRNWWTKDDREKFSAKTRALIAQYEAYEPLPGYRVNGALTLGENIGDNSGLAVAFKAYKQSLGGKASAVIDGFTGEQRLFLGWAQVWRGKMRDDSTVVQLKTDPHSPTEVRGTATLKNQPGFHDAFNVKPGDKMYLPPGERVTIW